MTIHVKKTVEAQQCQKCKNIQRQNNNHKTSANKALSFLDPTFQIQFTKFKT